MESCGLKFVVEDWPLTMVGEVLWCGSVVVKKLESL